MGKVKKTKPPRSRKTIVENTLEEEEQVPVDSKENALQTILDQLQAANVEEKYCGLQTLALLVENAENIEPILNRGIVKVAAPLLIDPASSVRNAAAGALRNLSTVKLEVCDLLMEQDIMTPLTCYFYEHAAEWTPETSSKTKDDDKDTFIQCTNLLLNLCESSELAVKYLGQSKILDILPSKAMGKVKKTKPPRSRKTIVENTLEEEEQVPVDSKENALQTILDQLQAANVEEKYCGLQTLALLVENAENIEPILNRGIVKVAAPLLIDPASSVRNAAAGALRNLSTVKLEVCDLLMEQDIMTPLTCYFYEHAAEWTPETSSKTKDDDKDTFIQCTNLLLNLCESSELAVKYLGQSKILDILPRYLNLSVFGLDVVIAVLQCLFVIVEDNPFAMEKVKANTEKQLQELITLDGSDPSILLIKTLAAGVIINTCAGNVIGLPANVVNEVISILANTLSVDHRLACNQLSSNVPLGDSKGKIIAPKGNEAKVLENQLKAVTQLLDAQQSAVEIVANLCSCEDGDENIDDESSDSEGDEEICNNSDEPFLSEDKLPPEVMEAMISLDIFDKVWSRTQLPAQNVMMILKEYEGSEMIYKKLHNVQTRALLCINNMLSTLPIDSVGGVNRVYKIWVDAGKLVFQQNADNVNLLESATAVMRASLDKLKVKENGDINGCNLFSDMALTDIEMMLTGIKECQVPEIRANLIRMIGILGLLLVSNLNDITSNVICTITEFILEQAHKETEVWVLAEAIDTIVDLYSEDETDSLAAKVKLVDKLAVLAPILKNKARQQKRLPKEYKVLVSTATSNLPRFIKYKKGRLCSL